MANKISKADRMRSFMAKQNGKPFTVAQVRASHPSLKNQNINSALEQMKDVERHNKKILCPVNKKRCTGFVYKPTTKKAAVVVEAKEPKTTVPQEHTPTVKEKIRTVGKRCTTLEHTSEKHEKQIEKLTAQVEQLKKALTEALESVEQLKGGVTAKPVETTTVVEPETIKPDTSSAKILAEISNRLATFSELLKKIGQPVPQTNETLEAIKNKTKLKVIEGDQITVEGDKARLKFNQDTGEYYGSLAGVPVSGKGISEFLAILPAGG
jgi:regulator of replication initiation timing